MLDVHRLRLLVELDRRGTISAVATALSYSPSTVSQQLDTLEREVGAALLEPAGRRVQLTAQARILVDYAHRILDVIDEAEAAVSASLTAVSGRVRVAVFQSASHAIMPQALSLLTDQHPGLRVEVTEREPEAGLLAVAARDFDLVLAEQYPGQSRPIVPGLDRVPLIEDEIRLALPPGTADGRAPGRATHSTNDAQLGSDRHAPNNGSVTAADADQDRVHGSGLSGLSDLTAWSGHPWVMEPLGTASRQWATQLCRNAGFEPDVRFETADLMAHVRLIRAGNAVGLLPDLVWAGETATVDTVRLRTRPQGTAEAPPRREVFTSARESAATRPAVAAVRAALSAAAKDTGI